MSSKHIAPPNNIIVLISEEERNRQFMKVITTNQGNKVSLITALPAYEKEDAYYSQAMDVGIVVSVGSEVKGVVPGMLAIVDYVVDTDNVFVIEVTGEGKLVSLPAVFEFHTDERIAYADRKTEKNTLIHAPGDIKTASPLIAVIDTDGNVIPNYPFIMLKPDDKDGSFEQDVTSSLYVPNNVRMSVLEEREVVAVNGDSDFATGDIVLVDDAEVFRRSVAGKKFDFVMQDDVPAKRI